MIRVLSCVLAMMFGVALVGCEAGARIDEPDRAERRDAAQPAGDPQWQDQRIREEDPYRDDDVRIEGDVEMD